jgi:hypothetical protein
MMLRGMCCFSIKNLYMLLRAWLIEVCKIVEIVFRLSHIRMEKQNKP